MRADGVEDLTVEQGEPEPDDPAASVPAQPDEDAAMPEDDETDETDEDDEDDDEDDEDDPGWEPTLLPPPWVEVTSPAHGIPLPYAPPEYEPPPASSSPLSLSVAGGLRAAPRWLLATTAGVAASAVLAVGSVVAVRLSSGHRTATRLAAISVELPGQVLGLPRRPEFGAADTSKVLSALPPDARAAVYSAGTGPAVVVVALRHRTPPSAAGGQAMWRSFEQSLGGPAADALHLADRDPGELGGRFACGRSADLVLCLATDPAATLGIVATGAVPGGLDAVAAIRRKVERLPD